MLFYGILKKVHTQKLNLISCSTLAKSYCKGPAFSLFGDFDEEEYNMLAIVFLCIRIL